MSISLNCINVGCCLGQLIINHLLYDDMVLVMPSAKVLQTLLDVCTCFAASHDILQYVQIPCFYCSWS